MRLSPPRSLGVVDSRSLGVISDRRGRRSDDSRATQNPPSTVRILSSVFSFVLRTDPGLSPSSNLQYTFFKPKFIIYATYLSEKIGYWRYISIYRHLQANPDDQLYPIFQYFENWCQDENRHGDFFTACLKARPEFINDFEAKLWATFFCLSVYVTMYLNDHSRTEFYESIGLNTTQFNMHVIHQTNKTTASIFPQVIDTYNPKFKEHLDELVVVNQKLAKAESPVEKAPLIASFAFHLLSIALMKPIDSGSIDFVEDVNSPAFMY